MKGVVNMAMDVKNMEVEERKKNAGVVAAHIHDALEVQRTLGAKGRFCGALFYGRHYGSYVTGLYLFIKVHTVSVTFRQILGVRHGW